MLSMADNFDPAANRANASSCRFDGARPCKQIKCARCFTCVSQAAQYECACITRLGHARPTSGPSCRATCPHAGNMAGFVDAVHQDAATMSWTALASGGRRAFHVSLDHATHPVPWLQVGSGQEVSVRGCAHVRCAARVQYVGRFGTKENASLHLFRLRVGDQVSQRNGGAIDVGGMLPLPPFEDTRPSPGYFLVLFELHFEVIIEASPSIARAMSPLTAQAVPRYTRRTATLCVTKPASVARSPQCVTSVLSCSSDACSRTTMHATAGVRSPSTVDSGLRQNNTVHTISKHTTTTLGFPKAG